ncbi:MAG: 3-keto-disaccharide hydrolase [Gemmataceae bacterium]
MRHAVPLALLLALAARAADAPNVAPAGFKSLFDGKSLAGWKVLNGKKEAWVADEAAGTIHTTKGGGGWLMSEKEYGDFELRLQFKVPAGANSGVALRAPMKGDPAYQGMEVQILDDAAPAYKGIKEWQHTGSVYGVVPSSGQPNRPLGEWNDYRIVCKGPKVTVELNGTKVVDADLNDHKEKHGKEHPGILRDKGHVGVQDHGGKIEFRNVFIKELD